MLNIKNIECRKNGGRHVLLIEHIDGGMYYENKEGYSIYTDESQRYSEKQWSFQPHSVIKLHNAQLTFSLQSKMYE